MRRVFREYLDGHGVAKITQGLRADGIRTRPTKRCPNGALLSLSRVGAMLDRKTYTGSIFDGDRVLYENAHAAIVDAETFAAGRPVAEHQPRVGQRRTRQACPPPSAAGTAQVSERARHDPAVQEARRLLHMLP